MKRIIFVGFLFIFFAFFYAFVETSHSSFGAQQENIFGQNKDDWIHTTSNSEVNQWARTYGGSGDEGGMWLAEKMSNGEYIIACVTSSFGAGGSDIWVLKLTSSGDIEWQYTYGGSSGEHVTSMQLTEDGGYIVAGYTFSFGAGSSDTWVLKLSSLGDIEWQRTYGGSDWDEAKAIQQTSDGGYVVAGYTASFGASNIWVLKLSSLGDIEWQRTYGGGGEAWGEGVGSIQLTEDGGYIVAGSTTSFGAGGYDIWVLKLTSSGDIEWQRTYGGVSTEEAESIRLTEDGGYIVGGHTGSFGAGGQDLWILKLTSSGDIEWQRTYGGSGLDWGPDIHETSDGGYIVSAWTESFGAGGRDGWILKLTSLGNIEWHRTYGGSGNSDMFHSIQEAIDGGYIVTGTTNSFGAGGKDLWRLKISPNGYIPSCGILGSSNALVSNTYISPSDTSVIPMDTNVIPLITDILPQESDAIVHNLCPGPIVLTLSATTGGTTDPEPGTHDYDGGVVVIVKAIPNSGYEFSSWSGDASGTNSTIQIVMDSNKSITAHFTALTTADGEETGKKGGCFIATAAYGSPLHSYVKTLHDFRDTYLIPNKIGRVLVGLYYKYSPFVADLISKHKVLKIAVRFSLMPLVAISYSMLHCGPVITGVMLFFIFMLPVFLFWRYRRKLRRPEDKNKKQNN